MSREGGIGAIALLLADITLVFLTGGTIGWQAFPYLLGDIIIGYSLGSALGSPATAGAGGLLAKKYDLQVSTCSEGLPVSEIFGVVKKEVNYFWYGNLKAKKIKASGGKGFGGSGSATVGKKYFLDVAGGICMGPVDELFTVYANDDVIYDDYVRRPADGQCTEIALDRNFGTLYFYWGTANQTQNSVLKSTKNLGEKAPYYPHFCYVVVRKLKLGMTPAAPTLKFVVGRYPVPGTTIKENPGEGLFSEAKTWTRKGANPIHAVAGMMMATGMPESLLNKESFQKVEHLLWKENMMLNMTFDSHIETEKAIQTALEHIDGRIRSKEDGTFHARVIRAPEESEIQIVDKKDVLEPPLFDRSDWSETANEVKATFAPRFVRERPEPADFIIIGEGGKIQKISGDGSPIWENPYENVLGPGIDCKCVAFGMRGLLVAGGRYVRVLNEDGEPQGSVITAFGAGVSAHSMASDGDTFLVAGSKVGSGTHTVLLDHDGVKLADESVILPGYYYPHVSCNGDFYIVTASKVGEAAYVLVDRENLKAINIKTFSNPLRQSLVTVSRAIASDRNNYLISYMPFYVRKITGGGKLKDKSLNAFNGQAAPSSICYNGKNYVLIGGVNQLEVRKPDGDIEKSAQTIAVETYSVTKCIAFNSRKYLCCGNIYGTVFELTNNNIIDMEDLVVDEYGFYYFPVFIALGGSVVNDCCALRNTLEV